MSTTSLVEPRSIFERVAKIRQGKRVWLFTALKGDGQVAAMMGSPTGTWRFNAYFNGLLQRRPVHPIRCLGNCVPAFDVLFYACERSLA